MRDQRQSSFSREKTQILERREGNWNRAKSKNPTNPSSCEKQISREILPNQEEAKLPLSVHRVTNAKFLKNQLSYSENSPLKSKERYQMSPYRQQEFEAYNFGYLGPLEHFQKKKRGRSYFYKKNEEKIQDLVDQASPKLHQNSQNQATRKRLPEQLQKPNTVKEQPSPGEAILEQLHYEMVKTLQQCKNLSNF